jgi:tRNA threonylcarbamoyladenosine biosynthesis protein TsaE
VIAARSFECADEAATARVGALLAAALIPGCVIYLRGELGAGKTTLARALIQTLAPGTRVKSPTYALVEPYEIGALSLFHLDLYRLADPSELAVLDVRELPSRGVVVLIEWPERGGDALPRADLDIELTYTDPGRRVAVRADSDAGEKIVAALGD